MTAQAVVMTACAVAMQTVMIVAVQTPCIKPVNVVQVPPPQAPRKQRQAFPFASPSSSAGMPHASACTIWT